MRTVSEEKTSYNFLRDIVMVRTQGTTCMGGRTLRPSKHDQVTKAAEG